MIYRSGGNYRKRYHGWSAAVAAAAGALFRNYGIEKCIGTAVTVTFSLDLVSPDDADDFPSIALNFLFRNDVTINARGFIAPCNFAA